MKQSILALFCTVLAFGSVTAHAQVAPSATSGQFSLTAGGEFSAFQPDYSGLDEAVESSPYLLYGIGSYVDVRFTRWVQLEAEGRWLHFNEYKGLDGEVVNENTYMAGPRIPIHTYGRMTPYGKFLAGWGNSGFLSGRAAVFAAGGGVDYRLSKRISARADFEYQRWNVNVTPVWPYGGSVGFSYRIF